MTSPPQRIIIAAMAQNRVIGNRDGLPWHLPEDYAHFLDSVRANTMLIGRKSWEIFGGDVDTAHNLVLTRSTAIAGATAVPTLKAGLELAASYGRTIFIAGGASVYEQALTADVVDAMYLSVIDGDYQGDAFFPTFDESQWSVIQVTRHDDFSLFHYRRLRGEAQTP